MKKQILTFASLAIIAVAGAIATTSAGSLNAKLSTDTTPDCKIQLEQCSPGPAADCEVGGDLYIGSDEAVGSCDEPMEFTR